MSRSWWPSGWKVGSRLRQLIPLPRAEVLAVAAVAAVAFVITLAILAGSLASRERLAATRARQEAARAQKKPILTTEELSLGVEDFMLPASPSTDTQPRYAPFRPRLARWTAEQAAKYWVAPRQVATEIVESENDQLIQRLFQDVK